MKSIYFGLALVFLLGLTGCGQTVDQVTDETESSSTTTEVSVDVTRSISLDEVAAHSTPEDCWLVINGKVYDVSGLGDAGHPGGDAVYEGCGIDATELFETRPMGSGTPHSTRAIAGLDNYFIGDLVVE